MMLMVAVDGSKTPDQIPDSLAFDHYFAAMSKASDPTAQPEEVARQKRMLSHLGLNPADTTELLATLAGFRAQLSPIEAQRNSMKPSGDSGQLFDSLRTAEDALVAHTQHVLAGVLSAEGMTALNQYVTGHVKQHIIIYTGSMNGGAN